MLFPGLDGLSYENHALFELRWCVEAPNLGSIKRLDKLTRASRQKSNLLFAFRFQETLEVRGSHCVGLYKRQENNGLPLLLYSRVFEFLALQNFGYPLRDLLEMGGVWIIYQEAWIELLL